MKKLITIIAVAMLLAACDGMDHNGCRDSVVKDAGTQQVVEVRPWHFVAKDPQGNVWYYETMNTTNVNITKKQPLFVQ